MLTRLIYIRHGETAWNSTGRWQGHAPIPLNDSGIHQANLLARYLAENTIQITTLYSSPTKRALQTAEIVAQAIDVPVHLDPDLREVDLGEWQGLTRQEVLAWDSERFLAFEADWYNVPTPNGENRNQLKARARNSFDTIAARHPGECTGVVSHGGTLGMLLESLFGNIERPTLTNTSMTLIEREHSGAPWRLVKVAWAPHLNESPLGETW
ncbi:MAG: histidine phosphatase family protein [Anaerolineae bacterium]|nr:histidine phosphatase family protein [Anaerolineae bacterium]